MRSLEGFGEESDRTFGEKKNTKISIKRKTSKNGRRVGEEGSFCSLGKKGAEKAVQLSPCCVKIIERDKLIARR